MSSKDSDDVVGQDQDADRRRNEINMFAAMALGGDDIVPADTETPAETLSQRNRSDSQSSTTCNYDPGSLKLASANSASSASKPAPSPPAAAASASSTPNKVETNTQSNSMAAFAAAAGGDPDSIQRMFSQAVLASDSSMDSGTFSMTPASRANSAFESGTFTTTSSSAVDSNDNNNNRNAGRGNLEAAAAALAIGDDDDDDDDDEETVDNMLRGGRLRTRLSAVLPMPKTGDSSQIVSRHKMTQEYPMYSEQVHMPRPLFFGPLLPPRVLREARLIVQEAIREQGYHNVTLDEKGEFLFETPEGTTSSGSGEEKKEQPPPDLPRLNSLPPEVQNLVGAIRMYGFGLSAFPSDNTITKGPATDSTTSSNGEKQGGESKMDIDSEQDKPVWKGTSYVSTFQPVFGDTARMFRQKHGVPPHVQHQIQQAALVQTPSNDSTQEENGKQEKEKQYEQQPLALGMANPGGLITKNYRKKKNVDAGSTSSAATAATTSTDGTGSAPITETDKANMSFLANINATDTDTANKSFLANINATDTEKDNKSFLANINPTPTADTEKANMSFLANINPSSDTEKANMSFLANINATDTETANKSFLANVNAGDSDTANKSFLANVNPSSGADTEKANMSFLANINPSEDTEKANMSFLSNVNPSADTDTANKSFLANVNPSADTEKANMSFLANVNPSADAEKANKSFLANVNPSADTEKANMSFLANVNASASGIDTTTTPRDTATKADKSAAGPVVPSNDINMFAMWARGEGTEESSPTNGNDDNQSRGNDSAGSFSMSPAGNNKKAHKAPSEISDITAPSTSASSANLGGGDTSNAPQPMSDQDLFSQWARGETPAQNNNDSSSNNNESFQNSFVVPETKSTLVKKPQQNKKQFDFQIPDAHNVTGTFQHIPTTTNIGGNDSDDDSIVGSELKRQVGVNEHLDAALASLADDGPAEIDHDDNDKNALLQDMMGTTPGGRPLSNLELSNGCVPIYGIDDSPLPVEGDLGIHETKIDEQRTLEQNRSQEIIDKYVGPNIFGPVACPNPAIGPDDNHSWNSRAAPSQRYGLGAPHGLAGGHADRTPAPPPQQSNTESPRPPAGPSRKNSRPTNQSPRLAGLRNKQSNASSTATPSSRKTSRGSNAGGSQSGSTGTAKRGGGRFNARHRYGWWSIPEDTESSTSKGGSATANLSDNSSRNSETEADNPRKTAEEESAEGLYQLPPFYHPSYNLQIDTRLQPNPEQLREENLPLSDMHAATSLAHGLPYLSDRPPSYRYLQIDTQAVGFPPLGGEVEVCA